MDDYEDFEKGSETDDRILEEYKAFLAAGRDFEWARKPKAQTLEEVLKEIKNEINL